MSEESQMLDDAASRLGSGIEDVRYVLAGMRREAELANVIELTKFCLTFPGFRQDMSKQLVTGASATMVITKAFDLAASMRPIIAELIEEKRRNKKG